MVQPSPRILSARDAARAARALETPSEVAAFEALAVESPSVRAYLDTDAWRAIYEQIVGDGDPSLSRPQSLEDMERFFRWSADQPYVDASARAAYLHCAHEVASLRQQLAPRVRPVASAA